MTGEEDGQPTFGIVITAREVYDQVVGLRSDIQTVVLTTTHAETKQADHEQRIRALEQWRYSIPAALVAAFLSAAVTLYTKIKG